jgi:hypothetical protein
MYKCYNDGMLMSYAEAVNKTGSGYLLSRSLLEKRIFRIQKGVYSDSSSVDVYALFSFTHPGAIYRMLSAEFLLGITDEVPSVISYASKMGSTRYSDYGFHQVFEKTDLYGLGRISCPRGDDLILIYGKERCLLDLIAHRAQVPYAHYLDMIRYYRAHQSELDDTLLQKLLSHYRYSDRIQAILEREVFE